MSAYLVFTRGRTLKETHQERKIMSEEKIMKAKCDVYRWATAMLTVGLLTAICTPALADDDHGGKHKYTLASLCGNYAAVVTYGANIAAGLGYEQYDGQGNATGSAVINQPGANHTRVLVNIGITGTYVVEKDGTGVRNLTITVPGGGTAEVNEDFVITKVKVIDGVAIATEIFDAQRQPSAVIEDQSMVTHTLTLRTRPESCVSGHHE